MPEPIHTVSINSFQPGFSTRPSLYRSLKFTKMENWWPSPDDAGAIEVFPGFASIGGSSLGAFNIQSIIYGEDSSLTRKKFVAGNTSVWTITDAGVTASIKSGLTAGLKVASVTYADLVHFYNGTDTPFKYNFTTVSNIGLTQPSTASYSTALFGSAGAGNVRGVVKYWFSEVDSNGLEGPLSTPIPGPGSNDFIDTGGGYQVKITCPTSTNNRKLYRTTAGAEVPFFVDDILASATAYFDNTLDTDLGGIAPKNGEAPPAGTNFPIVHFNRVWIADESKVYWSDLGEPESFLSGNYLAIWENDGDQISALARDREGIYIFKHNHIYKAIGKDPHAEIFNIIELTSSDQSARSIGTPSFTTIASTPIGLIFYYNKGFYLLNSESEIQYLSLGIEDELRADINANAQEEVVAGYFPEYRVYMASVPTGANTTNSRTYCYMIDTNSWFRLSEGFSAFGTVEVGTDGQPADGIEFWGCHVKSPAEALVQELFQTSEQQFNGTDITAEAVLPPLYLRSPGDLTRFLWLDLLFEAQSSGNITVNYKFDGETTGTDVSVSQVKSGAARWRKRVNLGQQATQVELGFKTSADQPQSKIYGVNIQGQHLGGHAQ